jgi:hypothetical protein
MNDVSENGMDFLQDLGNAVRKNPLSAALIGMGVLWLFTGGRPLAGAGKFVRNNGLDRIPDAVGGAFDRARSTLRSGADVVGDGVASVNSSVSDSATNVLENAKRYVREFADPASEYMSSIPETGAEMFDAVRSNLSEVFRAQPLALGAIGIAIGAGIAAALPATELEADYLGDASSTLRSKTAEFASDQADHLKAVAGNVAEVVADEARKQGLTVEGAKSAADDFSKKVSRVVDTAGKGIADRVKSKAPQ